MLIKDFIPEIRKLTIHNVLKEGLIERLENSMDPNDLIDPEDLMETMEDIFDDEGLDRPAIILGPDACYEYMKVLGHSDDDTYDDEEVEKLIKKNFKGNIPKDFPYDIVTDEGEYVLYRSKIYEHQASIDSCDKKKKEVIIPV